MSGEFTISRSSPASGLTEQERLSRICELLSKAVVADYVGEIVQTQPAAPRPAAQKLPATDASDRKRVLSYLALVGGRATPGLIRATLGLPRMRLYRAVQPMLANGRLVASGHTNTIEYSLAPGSGVDPERN